MPIITAIETQKHHPDRVNIELDGEYAFGLAGLVAAGLKVGESLVGDGRLSEIERLQLSRA